jgi:hypothetical protein
VGGERTTALVVEAEAPLDNLIKVGKRSHGSVRILVGEGPDRIYTNGGRHKRDKEHWLVRGMEVPVSIDPANPEAFEVLWDQIPSMAERAAANDPALTDPIGTRRKVAEAVIAATSAIDTSAMPPQLGKAIAKAQRESAEVPDIMSEQLAQAEQEPAPAGKQRGVVLMATSVLKVRSEGGDPDGGGPTQTYETSQGKHDTVLSVNIPGLEPYAVYKENFKHPRKATLALGAGVPALISTTDPADIDVLWEHAEAAGAAKLSQRLDAAQQKMQETQQMMSGQGQPGELEQAMLNAQQEAIKSGPPAVPAAGAPQANPQMRQMMIQNAKMALTNTPPQMRPMLIQQYRLMGIEIDDQGNVVE